MFHTNSGTRVIFCFHWTVDACLAWQYFSYCKEKNLFHRDWSHSLNHSKDTPFIASRKLLARADIYLPRATPSQLCYLVIIYTRAGVVCHHPLQRLFPSILWCFSQTLLCTFGYYSDHIIICGANDTAKQPGMSLIALPSGRNILSLCSSLFNKVKQPSWFQHLTPFHPNISFDIVCSRLSRKVWHLVSRKYHSVG